MGKMMEQGPVLIVTFQAQLVMVIKNPKGEVYDGDPVSGSHGDGGLGPSHTQGPCTPPQHRARQLRELERSTTTRSGDLFEVRAPFHLTSDRVSNPAPLLWPLLEPSPSPSVALLYPTQPGPSPCWVSTGQGAANAIRVGTL